MGARNVSEPSILNPQPRVVVNREEILRREKERIEKQRKDENDRKKANDREKSDVKSKRENDRNQMMSDIKNKMKKSAGKQDQVNIMWTGANVLNVCDEESTDNLKVVNVGGDQNKKKEVHL